MKKKKKKPWFLIFPLKHKLLNKEIFKSQKLLWRDPTLAAGKLARDTSGIPGLGEAHCSTYHSLAPVVLGEDIFKYRLRENKREESTS